MSKLNQILNKEVANFGLLYTKLHNYHWYVKGKGFFTLHGKFEELYDKVTEYQDEVAERLLTIGGSPVATLKDVLSTATLKEATGKETPDEMIKNLAADFETLIEEMKEGIKVANEEGDDVTADMFVGMSKDLQKTVWMLKAFLA